MELLNCNFISWNVRSLNSAAKGNVVQETVVSSLASVAYNQKTKLDVIDRSLSIGMLGPSFEGFCYWLAIQTRGGILLDWGSDKVVCLSTSIRGHSIMAMVVFPCGSSSGLMVVYGPTNDTQKPAFLQELRDIRTMISVPWLILGDFNQIWRAQDKNFCRLNRQLMSTFNSVVEDLELREVHLNGCAFTWTSARERPTLEKINKVFVSSNWEILFPDNFLQAVPSTTSDHCLLLLSSVFLFSGKKRFRFEAFWTKIDGFSEAVQVAWHCSSSTTDPLRQLHCLLKATSHAL